MTTLTRINVDDITEIPDSYPDEFIEFCKKHNLKPPSIKSSNGKALSIMLAHPNKYFDRDSCDQITAKLKIPTRDSIQNFNKNSQWGIATNSGTERGRLYIKYPYELSNKHRMRKNFKFDGTEEEKRAEIDRIKSTIRADYIDPPYESWQLGHRNPCYTGDNGANLVLQPPIQGKYRDDYLFFDTLTKMPLPQKLKKMLETGEVSLTEEQVAGYLAVFEGLLRK